MGANLGQEQQWDVLMVKIEAMIDAVIGAESKA